MKSFETEEKNGRKQCPVCLETARHSLVEKWYEYTIWHCPLCDVVFSMPMKHPGKGFYEGSAGDYFERVYQARNLGLFSIGPNHRWALKYLPAKSGSLLDLGCGNGSFLLHARREGFVPWGVDLSETAVKAGRRYLGIDKIFACNFEKFKEEVGAGLKFDVVTFFEVLEHMDDPNAFMDTVKGLTRPRGFIALSVPNRERPLAHILMSKAGDSPPHHFTRWSKRAISGFLERHGFEIMRLSTVPVSTAAGAIMDYFCGTDKISSKVNRSALDRSLSLPLRLGCRTIRTLGHAFLKTMDIFLYPLHRKVCLVVIARMD